uniref:Putative secreted protein n=1 Tax=Ixodes ricinus TaxID=34613 RepID=A0A147BN69_IXORI
MVSAFCILLLQQTKIFVIMMVCFSLSLAAASSEHNGNKTSRLQSRYIPFSYRPAFSNRKNAKHARTAPPIHGYFKKKKYPYLFLL